MNKNIEHDDTSRPDLETFVSIAILPSCLAITIQGVQGIVAG